MGNVHLPTPVALAGGVMLVLAGYLAGVVLGPDATDRTTATVASYDSGSGRLCLTGDGVQATDDDALCGTWRRTEGSRSTPRAGDRFQYVTMSTTEGNAGQGPVTVIFGDVVP